MRELSLGYSPCPNDTFIFFALIHGKVHAPGVHFSEVLSDVEALNQMALEGTLDVTKVSAHAAAVLLDEYCVLRSGGALGRGCGPLIVAREKVSPRELKGKTIAVPGGLTTAFLLLRLFDPELSEGASFMVFSDIMDAVSSGKADAGLIIHEGRFTYPSYGLAEVMDLGVWWEKETGLPIPLGVIMARRSLGRDIIVSVENTLRESVLYAYAHREETLPYIRHHSQELDDDVIDRHIGLYVNDFSVELGSEGEKALERMFDMAAEKGILKSTGAPLFTD